MHALKLGEVAVVRRQAFEHRIVVDKVRVHLHHALVVEGHLGILDVDGVYTSQSNRNAHELANRKKSQLFYQREVYRIDKKVKVETKR